MTPKEAFDEFWRLWFLVFKSLAIAATLIVYFFALVVYNAAMCVFIGAEWLLRGVDDWQPEKPQIFELEE